MLESSGNKMKFIDWLMLISVLLIIIGSSIAFGTYGFGMSLMIVGVVGLFMLPIYVDVRDSL